MSTLNEFGMAGAMLEPNGRIKGGYGLRGGKPSQGLKVCPDCEGHGEHQSHSLVHNICGRCNGSGQVKV